jgi:hypothetical protein
VNFLLVWLFGAAPFFKVVPGFHFCLIFGNRAYSKPRNPIFVLPVFTGDFPGKRKGLSG